MTLAHQEIYSQNPLKQANILAGCSGSFISEITSKSIPDFKSWIKEWNDTDFSVPYDFCFQTDWTDQLEESKDLEQVLEILVKMNLEANFQIHKKLLANINIECFHIYEVKGRVLIIETEKGFLELDCSQPTFHAFDKWLEENGI